MYLSDRDIRARLGKDLVVEPIENLEEQLGPASLDVRLGHRFRSFRYSHHSLIDPLNYIDEPKVEYEADGAKVIKYDYSDLFIMQKPFIIHPGNFVLGSTYEKITIPPDLAARLEGRSSLGRVGLIIHATAGWIDPGFSGHPTFEIANIGNIPVKLYPKMRVAQLVFVKLTSPAEIPYNKRKSSKYYNELGATESRIGEDAEFTKK